MVEVWRSSFLLSFMLSLNHVRNKIMYALSWQTLYALTWVLFQCLFPSLLHSSGNKHQNNPLFRAETIFHSSTYIIFYTLTDISRPWANNASGTWPIWCIVIVMTLSSRDMGEGNIAAQHQAGLGNKMTELLITFFTSYCISLVFRYQTFLTF